ncbi:hypothetical protein NQ176_g2449 [Zarea fungicola]|uniref:Uncharacterized protein n=1 Tax=Zarea fungicola TaxID=93591 RepID=A0ACC1NPD2_9HYPO|nr:hypothetical protein NQ176_g2449 [Lecanicillium fungicola]
MAKTAIVRSNPTETSPLLAAPAADPEAACTERNGTSHDAGKDANDLGNRIYIVLPAVAIGLLLSAVDQLITLASYTKMGNELNALNSVGWIATS